MGDSQVSTTDHHPHERQSRLAPLMQPRQDLEGGRWPHVLRLPAVQAVGRREGPVAPNLGEEDEVTCW